MHQGGYISSKAKGLLQGFLLFIFLQGCLPASLPEEISKARVVPSTLVSEALMRIQLDYARPRKLKPRLLLGGALGELEREFPELRAQLRDDAEEPLLLLQLGFRRLELPLVPLHDMYALSIALQRLQGVLAENGLGRDANLEQLLIRGVCSQLDPYTVLLPRKVHREFRDTVGGRFAGVGLMVGFRENQLIVISPMDGSPAARAGVQPMDRIIRVDGVSTEHLTLEEILFRLRGEKGSRVSLHVMRAGESAPLSFELVREDIRVASVNMLRLSEEELHFLYVRIKNFQETTADELKNMLGNPGSSDGVILDLRNNPGGLLEQAAKVSDLFLDSGKRIVSTRSRAIDQQFDSRRLFMPAGWLTVPLVVLVNRGSASASEIVTAALMQNGRAVVVGERTFGKGTVQSLWEMSDGSGFKLTIGDYLTPSGESINHLGVRPDLELMPVNIGDNRTSLFQRHSDRRRDGDGIAYFFLEPPPLPMEERIASMEKPDRDSLRDDFYIKTAKAILGAEIPFAPERSPALERAVASLVDAEENRIVRAMKELNVDWSRPVNTQHPEPEKLQWKVSWSADGKKWIDIPANGQLPGGHAAHVRVTLHNRSETDASRLLVLLHAGNEALNGLELPLGLVRAGETVTGTRMAPLAPGTLNPLEPLDFMLYDDRRRVLSAKKMHLRFDQSVLPRFEFIMSLIDDGSYDSKGNGDGQAQPGETMALLVKIRNIGNGISENTLLFLKRSSGTMSISRGRLRLGRLAPGETKEESLLFQLPPRPKAEGELELEIRDLNANLPGMVFPWSLGEGPGEQWLQPPELTGLMLERTMVSSSVQDGSVSRMVLRGEVRGDSGLKDMYVFLNGRKIHYQTAAKEGNPRRLSFSVPLANVLEKNTIEVTGRGLQGLSKVRQLEWWSPEREGYVLKRQ